VKIYHDTVSFEVKDSNSEEKRDCCRVEVVEVSGKLWVIFVVLYAITNDYNY